MIHCRKTDEVTIELFDSADKLPVEWQDFIPQGHYLTASNLHITESVKLPDLDFYYVLVCIKGKPLLATSFQLLQLKSAHINHEMVQPHLHILWRLFTTVARPKLLVGGHLFRHDVSAIFYSTDISDYDAYTYYKSAIDKAFHESCASAMLIKDMPGAFNKYFANYNPEYLMLRNDISMEMDIPAEWNNIEDYERALKHKYAQRYRKIRQQWAPLDIREFSTSEVERKQDEIFRLYKQVTDHQQVRIGLLNATFLPMLKKHYGDVLRVWGIYENDKLIGFFSAWIKDEVFDMFYIGFDYEKNKELNLYFNILFFSIEQAIHFRKNKLILGRTALDAKARLGCKPKYLSTFVYIKNNIIRQRILAAQKNTSDREGAWESRHPLKNQQ